MDKKSKRDVDRLVFAQKDEPIWLAQILERKNVHQDRCDKACVRYYIGLAVFVGSGWRNYMVQFS